MKKITISLFIIVIISSFSCKRSDKTRKEINLSIQEFKQEDISIRAIYAVDNETVYYAGSNGCFASTKNAGKTWEKKTITYQDSIKPAFRSIAFNGTDFFILSIENPALLYRIHEGDTDLVYIENNQKVFYDSMTFFDEKNGIALGDPTENCLSIITTKDGGISWKKTSCLKLPKIVEGEAAFAASNTNIKTIGGSVWAITGGAKARVFKSTNKGITWHVFETPIIQGQGAQGIYSVDFIDENNGIIIGGDYSKPKENKQNKAITKDGGLTWQLVAQGQDPDYRSCIQYVPDTNGQEIFAVGKMGISFSSNAGLSWKKISNADYFAIQFVDKHTAWLGGHQKIGLMHF